MIRTTGTFTNTDNITYQLEILNRAANQQAPTIEKTIGRNGLFFNADEPLLIEQDVEDTFQHVLSKSLTINLYSNEYCGDYFFANNANSVEVTVTDITNNKVVFYGGLEPQSYSQGFSQQLENITLHAVDKLGLLEYSNYQGIGSHDYEAYKADAGIISFHDILRDCLGSYTNVYYDNSRGVDNQHVNSVFDDISVSEIMMLGDDVDDIMKKNEVLEEVLKYLNLHIVQVGEDFFIFDWETIKQGNAQWHNINSGQTIVIEPLTINLANKQHADAGTEISTADVYTQLQITCDLNSDEKVITSPLDKDSLTSPYANIYHYMREYSSDGEGIRAFNAFYHMLTGEYDDYANAKMKDWFLRPLFSKQWKFYTPNGQTIDNEVVYNNNTAINAYTLPQYLHANTQVGMLAAIGSVETSANQQDNSPIANVKTSNYLIISVNGNDINNNLPNEQQRPNETDLQENIPLCEFVNSNNGAVYSPSDDDTTNYLVFSGKLRMQPLQKETQPYIDEQGRNIITDIDWDELWHVTVPSDNNDDGRYYTRQFYANETPNSADVTLQGTSIMMPTETKKNFLFQYNYTADGQKRDTYSKLPILECELIIGDKRCVEINMDEQGNSTFVWIDKNGGVEQTYIDDNGVEQTYLKTTFSIGINPKIGDYIIGPEYALQNTIHYWQNVDAEGTAIPIKKSDGLSGKVEFRILGLVNCVWDDVTRRHPTMFRHTKFTATSKLILPHVSCIFLKDFNAKIYTDNAGYSVMQDEDLIYLSVENEVYQNKKDDIDFQLVTGLTAEEAFNKNVQTDNLYNVVLSTTSRTPLTTIYNNITQEYGKAEEHYINQYYQEYSSVKLLIDSNLHNNGNSFNTLYYVPSINSTMYPIATSYDLYQGTAQVKMKQL